MINYVVSHDERRPEHEIQFWGEHIQLADPVEARRYRTRWELAMQKARLGAVALLTSPGVPMLLAGQEFGEDCERTIAFWPLDWTKLDLPQGRSQFDFYRRLLRARREHPALRSGFVEYYGDDFARTKLLRYKRWDGAGDVAVVGLNFDNRGQKVGMGFPHNGTWLDVISGEVVAVPVTGTTSRCRRGRPCTARAHLSEMRRPDWLAAPRVRSSVVGLRPCALFDECVPDEYNPVTCSPVSRSNSHDRSGIRSGSIVGSLFTVRRPPG